MPKSPFSCRPTAPAARVLLRGFWDSTEEGAWIAAQIRSRVMRGQELSSIAILVRSQEQVQALLPHLVAAGVPVAMQPLGAVDAWWKAHEVRCAVHGLRLVRSTADDEAAQMLLQAWGGLSAAAIDTMQRVAVEQQRSLLNTAYRAVQHGRVPAAAASRLTFFFSRFSHWQEVASKGGFKAVLEAIAADHAGWCTDGGHSMRRLTRLGTRCGSLQQLLTHSAFGATSSQVKSGPGATSGAGGSAVGATAPGSYGNVASGAAGPSTTAAQDAGTVSFLTIHYTNMHAHTRTRARTCAYARTHARTHACTHTHTRMHTCIQDVGAVSLLTIHRSKGLEWDIVYLPGWEQGTFPLVPSSSATDEEWRLAYVALTRAKLFAGITHASRRHWRGRWHQRLPSDFLQLLPTSSVSSFSPNQVRPYYDHPAPTSYSILRHPTTSYNFLQHPTTPYNALHPASCILHPASCILTGETILPRGVCLPGEQLDVLREAEQAISLQQHDHPGGNVT